VNAPWLWGVALGVKGLAALCDGMAGPPNALAPAKAAAGIISVAPTAMEIRQCFMVMFPWFEHGVNQLVELASQDLRFQLLDMPIGIEIPRRFTIRELPPPTQRFNLIGK